VSATDAKKKLTWYSNTGAGLTVTAPGGDAKQSTTGTGLGDSVYSTIGDFDGDGNRISSFGGMDGTSMSAPHVSGVMALMRYVNPNISLVKVMELFRNGELTDDVGAAGYDTTFGWGMINARKAIDAALKAAGTPDAPAEESVVAQPSSINFGSTLVSAEINFTVTGQTDEKVTGIVSNSPAMTIRPKAADSVNVNTKLGVYVISLDRSKLPAGSNFVTLTITTTKRSFDVQISAQKIVAGATARGDVGRVYVAIFDGKTGEFLTNTSAVPVNGSYSWSFHGSLPSSVYIGASTDIDNDDDLCQRGEVCGTYPTTGAEWPQVSITGDMSGLDFTSAPVGGVSATSLSIKSSSPRIAFRKGAQ